MTKVIITTVLGVGLVLAATAFWLSLFQANNVRGSVVEGSEYTATTTSSNHAGADILIKSTTDAPRCILGSVVIASTTDVSVRYMNATSTTDVSSTTLAFFPANAAAGTYTVDSSCSRGIVIEPATGYDGFFITTYR
jgi:hypothetical protein